MNDAMLIKTGATGALIAVACYETNLPPERT